MDKTWRLWTDRDLAELRSRYPTETATDIAGSLDRTYAAVRRRVAILGLEKSDGRYQRLHRHYAVQADAFAELTPDTAYVLGMILADGSISGNRVKITNNNLDLIQEVRRILGTNCRVNVPKQIRDRSFTIHIVNKQMASDLARMGIIENKSLTGRWPAGVPDGLFGPLLRGYFDGDGSAKFSPRHGLQVKFTSGSPGLLRDLAGELGQRGLPLGKVTHDNGRPNANRLYYSGSSAALIGHAMYEAPGFFIDRKRQPFISYADHMRASRRRCAPRPG